MPVVLGAARQATFCVDDLRVSSRTCMPVPTGTAARSSSPTSASTAPTCCFADGEIVCLRRGVCTLHGSGAFLGLGASPNDQPAGAARRFDAGGPPVGETNRWLARPPAVERPRPDVAPMPFGPHDQDFRPQPGTPRTAASGPACCWSTWAPDAATGGAAPLPGGVPVRPARGRDPAAGFPGCPSCTASSCAAAGRRPPSTLRGDARRLAAGWWTLRQPSGVTAAELGARRPPRGAAPCHALRATGRWARWTSCADGVTRVLVVPCTHSTPAPPPAAWPTPWHAWAWRHVRCPSCTRWPVPRPSGLHRRAGAAAAVALAAACGRYVRTAGAQLPRRSRAQPAPGRPAHHCQCHKSPRGLLRERLGLPGRAGGGHLPEPLRQGQWLSPTPSPRCGNWPPRA